KGHLSTREAIRLSVGFPFFVCSLRLRAGIADNIAFPSQPPKQSDGRQKYNHECGEPTLVNNFEGSGFDIAWRLIPVLKSNCDRHGTFELFPFFPTKYGSHRDFIIVIAL